MKTLLVTLAIITGSFAIRAQSGASDKIKVHVHRIEQPYEKPIYRDGKKLMHAFVSIRNLTSDTLYFVVENCQYTSMFMTNKESIETWLRPCDRNFPIWDNLAPASEILYELPLLFDENSDNSAFKIGMKARLSDEIGEFLDDPLYDSAEIIWSSLFICPS